MLIKLSQLIILIYENVRFCITFTFMYIVLSMELIDIYKFLGCGKNLFKNLDKHLPYLLKNQTLLHIKEKLLSYRILCFFTLQK